MSNPMAEPGTRAIIVEAARAHAFDLYLSALLAPASARDDLIVLAAFEGEIDRIPHVVSEPLLADIRLQWWRDVIASAGTADGTGNPTADALADVIARRGLDADGLIASIDARAPRDAADEATPAEQRLLATDAAAMHRALRVLQATPSGGNDAAFLDAAGLAVTEAREAMSTEGNDAAAAAMRARGHLERARSLAGKSRRDLRLSALPVALVEPYLRAWEKARRSKGQAMIVPFARVWRLWWFARIGRM